MVLYREVPEGTKHGVPGYISWVVCRFMQNSYILIIVRCFNFSLKYIPNTAHYPYFPFYVLPLSLIWCWFFQDPNLSVCTEDHSSTDNNHIIPDNIRFWAKLWDFARNLKKISLKCLSFCLKHAFRRIAWISIFGYNFFQNPQWNVESVLYTYIWLMPETFGHSSF